LDGGEKMKELSFENALSELEGVVEKMEEGNLKLNESLALFEKGVKLAKFLREELDKAEKKIEILVKDEKGEVSPEPFELKGEEAPTEEKEDKTGSGEDDEIPF
jgi:exodeoxyribonuclease VII small subunit